MAIKIIAASNENIDRIIEITDLILSILQPIPFLSTLFCFGFICTVLFVGNLSKNDPKNKLS